MWDSFWDFIWYTLVIFAFIAYLMILFNVLADLFRDHKTSGLVKAIWIIFLILLPYITVFVYLISRGRSMAERAHAQQTQARKEADAYIRQAAGTASPSDQIASAKVLLSEGTITQAEFEQLKAKALA